MSMPILIGIIVLTVVIYTIVNACAKAEHPFRKSVFGIISGFFSLAAVNLLSSLTNVAIPVSSVSLLVSAIGGVPGVTLMLALNAFF